MWCQEYTIYDEVIPGIFIGAAESLENKYIKENITRIINVTKNVDKPEWLKNEEDFFRIPVDDSITADLQPYLDQAVTFIKGK